MKNLTLLLFAVTCYTTVVAKNGHPGIGRQINSLLENQQAKNYAFVIIPSINGTWGYDIYSNGKIFIHQTSKPGLTGNEGFATKAKAKKVAELVVSKLQKGEIPPSITAEEMKKLKVL